MVLKYANNYRTDELTEKTTDIGIYYFTEEEKELYLDTNGQYRPLYSNRIYLRSDDKKDFKDASAHEFVHLMQRNNQFLYVILRHGLMDSR